LIYQVHLTGMQAIPSPEQRRGARLASQNVQRHFLAAETLSRERLYGIARSHLILAAEESMKALTLSTGMFIGKNPDVDFGFIFNHKGRLGFAAIFAMVFSFVDQLRTKIHTPGMTQSQIQRWQKQIQGNIESGRSAVLSLMEWWIEAGDLRNDGFYVDYRDHRWKSPGRITKSSYQSAKKRTEMFINMAISIKDLTPKDFEALGKILQGGS